MRNTGKTSLTIGALFLSFILIMTAIPIIVDTDYVNAGTKNKKIKITFNANKGKASKKKKTVKYLKKYGVLPTATRSGYKFSGWYTKKTGGKKITAKSKVRSHKKHKLYAHWKKVVAVTFKNSLYGDVIKKKKITYGSKYGKLPTISATSGKKVSFWLAYKKGYAGFEVTPKSKIGTKMNHIVYPVYSYSKGLHAQEAQKVFELVNTERIKAGVEPLKFSARIKTTTDVRAKEISTYFSHTRPNGDDFDSSDPDILDGENIAAGQDDAYYVMNSWMTSPGHKANILNPDYKSIGISMYCAKDGKLNTYFVQCFSRSNVE